MRDTVAPPDRRGRRQADQRPVLELEPGHRDEVLVAADAGELPAAEAVGDDLAVEVDGERAVDRDHLVVARRSTSGEFTIVDRQEAHLVVAVEPLVQLGGAERERGDREAVELALARVRDLARRCSSHQPGREHLRVHAVVAAVAARRAARRPSTGSPPMPVCSVQPSAMNGAHVLAIARSTSVGSASTSRNGGRSPSHDRRRPRRRARGAGNSGGSRACAGSCGVRLDDERCRSGSAAAAVQLAPRSRPRAATGSSSRRRRAARPRSSTTRGANCSAIGHEPAEVGGHELDVGAAVAQDRSAGPKKPLT